MLQFNPTGTLNLETLYTEGKFWMAFAGGLWTLFKCSQWLKEIRTVDLAGLRQETLAMRQETKAQTEALAAGIKENTTAVTDSFRETTTAVVRELGELRQDFRSFYTTAPAQTPQRVKARARAAAAGR